MELEEVDEIIKDCAVPPDEDGFTPYGSQSYLNKLFLILGQVHLVFEELKKSENLNFLKFYFSKFRAFVKFCRSKLINKAFKDEI